MLLGFPSVCLLKQQDPEWEIWLEQVYEQDDFEDPE
jgi:hypothetical protein